MNRKLNRMIIVEGMDNTGKTTLIQRLIRESGRGYLSAMVSLGPNKTMMEQLHWANSQIWLSKIGAPLTVYDRFLPFCDVNYGSIIRGGSIWSMNHFILRELLEESHPLIIYCRPSSRAILGFEDGRDQMAGVKENARELLDLYDKNIEELRERGFKVITYNFELNDRPRNATDLGNDFDYISQRVQETIKNHYINL